MALPEDDDRHQIYLAKLTSGLLNSKVYPSLDAAYRAVRLLLLDAEDLGTQAKLNRVLKQIEKEIRKQYGAGLDGLTVGLGEMAVYEAGYSAQLFGAYAGIDAKVPAKAKVLDFINSSIMTLEAGKRVNFGTWADYVQGNIDSSVQAINGAVVQGYQQGRTVNQIARDIRDLSDGILKSNAEALARTGQSHYANNAREAMAASNSAFKFRVYQATFDNRTSLGCRSLHGKSWPSTADDYVRLPRHYNCRSVYVFVRSLEDAKRGTMAAVGGKSADDINPNRKLRYRGKRDLDLFKPGQIDAGTDMDKWMRSQPDWFIESSLGKTRAKLLKDGKMSIKKFTDATGQSINLDELRRLDAEAFKRAGL